MSGSTSALTEGPYTYDAYGAVSATTGEPFKFIGRRLDPETGLYYYRARYYTPAWGRFLQIDPVGYSARMNLYLYINNDPVNRADPLELCDMDNCNMFADQQGLDQSFVTRGQAAAGGIYSSFDLGYVNGVPQVTPAQLDFDLRTTGTNTGAPGG